MTGYITARDAQCSPEAVSDSGFPCKSRTIAKRPARVIEKALQAVLIGALSLLLQHEQSLPQLLLLAAGSTLVKAIVVPWLLGDGR